MVVFQVLGPVPFGAQHVFQVPLVQLHRVALGVHRFAAFKLETGHVHRGRGYHRRRRHGRGRRLGFLRHFRRLQLGRLDFWRLHFGPVRFLGLVRRLFLHHFHGDLLQFLAQQPFPRRKVEHRPQQHGVENSRNRQVDLRRVLLFGLAGLRQHGTGQRLV